MSRNLCSVRPVMSHSLSRYSYALSARAPTEKEPPSASPFRMEYDKGNRPPCSSCKRRNSVI